jgi:hypothetical protein
MTPLNAQHAETLISPENFYPFDIPTKIVSSIIIFNIFLYLAEVLHSSKVA